MKIEIGTINHNEKEERVSIIWDSESGAILSETVNWLGSIPGAELAPIEIQSQDTELRAGSVEAARDVVIATWGAAVWGLDVRTASSLLAQVRGATGGQVRSDVKASAARANGKRGGRPARFRFDTAYNAVYEYDAEARAYLFCGKLNGRTQAQFKKDYDRE